MLSWAWSLQKRTLYKCKEFRTYTPIFCVIDPLGQNPSNFNTRFMQQSSEYFRTICSFSTSNATAQCWHQTAIARRGWGCVSLGVAEHWLLVSPCTETSEITTEWAIQKEKSDKEVIYVVLLIITLGCSHLIRFGAWLPFLVSRGVGAFPIMAWLLMQRCCESLVLVSFFLCLITSNTLMITSSYSLTFQYQMFCS